MGYLAIARKWRPSRFEDLVGQTHVVQTLKNAIRLDRVSHAYLFSGARGIGKTSVARIFAKALRCPQGRDGVPCNQCEECRAITESRAIDVMEIDGASNNGVEAVRGIRENVAYGCSSGRYKIYIIDEVHMLSLSAFNALLKTLEEPPSHVIFIFATTEAQKLPLTILSRCQHFEFRRLTHTQIIERLRHILAEEKVNIMDEGLRTLASHSDGSLRDALSLLDQVLSYLGDIPDKSKPIEELQIVQALGVSSTNQITEFLSRILNEEPHEAVRLVGESYMAGIDLKHFAERCLGELRLLYLCLLARDKNQPCDAEQLDISTGHFASLKKMMDQASLLQVERMAQILSKSASQLSWSSQPLFLLEMAAVRMSYLTELDKVGKTAQPNSPAASVPKENPKLPAEAHQPRQQPPPKQNSSVEPAADSTKPVTEKAPVAESSTMNSPAHASSQHVWKNFVDTVMKKRPLLGALLCHANFKLEGSERAKTVILAFNDNNFYERQAKDSKAQIEEQLKSFFGPQTVLILGANSAGTMKSIEHSKQAEAADLKKMALEHPTVTQMKEILGAEVVDITVDI